MASRTGMVRVGAAGLAAVAIAAGSAVALSQGDDGPTGASGATGARGPVGPSSAVAVLDDTSAPFVYSQQILSVKVGSAATTKVTF